MQPEFFVLPNVSTGQDQTIKHDCASNQTPTLADSVGNFISYNFSGPFEPMSSLITKTVFFVL
jgi:hypothetical protein